MRDALAWRINKRSGIVCLLKETAKLSLRTSRQINPKTEKVRTRTDRASTEMLVLRKEMPFPATEQFLMFSECGEQRTK